MSNALQSPLITPKQLKQELPATLTQIDFIEQSRDRIRRILNGADPRLLLIIGPCSIHDLSAATHYAKLLQELSDEVQDEFFIIMRAYFEKPRTSLGWKGLVYDPQLDGSHDINAGLHLSRKLLSDLATLGIPTATEILEPMTYNYFGDLVSWGCIGARTTSSQIHRQMASGLGLPVAFKNNTDGNIEVAINGAITASEPHSYIGINDEGYVSSFRSKGNPDCHIVLRGSECSTNYDSTSINHAIAMLEKSNLPLRLIVDCSHDNSKRNHTKQADVFDDVLEQFMSGNRYIRGVVLESNLDAGHQTLGSCPSHLRYGVSVTDPCLDWASTVAMVRKARQKIQASHHSQLL